MMMNKILHLILILLHLSVCYYQYELRIDVDLTDKTCPEERRLFEKNVRSIVLCAFMCMNDASCLGISYQRGGNICIGCQAYKCLSNTNGFEMLIGGEFYIVKNKYLVSGVRPVPDSYLSASSSWNFFGQADPNSSRICSFSSQTSQGAWATPGQDEWIQMRFWGLSEIMAVVTAGRNDATDQYVKAFKVLYSIDCSTFVHVKDDGGQDMIFSGNTDRFTIVHTPLPHPVHALCVRINPTEWNNYIAMRVEVVGYVM